MSSRAENFSLVFLPWFLDSLFHFLLATLHSGATLDLWIGTKFSRCSGRLKPRALFKLKKGTVRPLDRQDAEALRQRFDLEER